MSIIINIHLYHLQCPLHYIIIYQGGSFVVKAFVHQNDELKFINIDLPRLHAEEVLVDIKVAGVNRRDLYVPHLRQGAKDPLVLGSDGTGVVAAIGDQVTNVSVGDEVIINPALGWFEKSAAPPENFEILGMPDDGS